MDGDSVKQIAFNHGDKKQTHITHVSIMNGCNEPGMQNFNDIETYNTFYKAWDCVRKDMLSSTHISVYDKETIDVFKRLRRANNRGILNEAIQNQVDNADVIQIDFNKYYPHILMNMPSIPVLQGCEKFEAYNGEPIEDMNCYVIRMLDNELIYSKQEVCTSWGVNLKSMMKHVNIEIKLCLRPAYLKPNHFKSSMKKIWSNEDLTAPHKKRIANLQIGNAREDVS
jgi:hypothetical protein